MRNYRRDDAGVSSGVIRLMCAVIQLTLQCTKHQHAECRCTCDGSARPEMLGTLSARTLDEARAKGISSWKSWVMRVTTPGWRTLTATVSNLPSTRSFALCTCYDFEQPCQRL